MNEAQPPAGGLSHAEKARMYQLLADHEDLQGKGEHLPHEDAAELHGLVARDGERYSLLLRGRIPLTSAEHDAVDALIAKNPNERVGLTRRDPGETGPLLVHVGDSAYVVDAAGHARKQKAVA